MTKQNVVSPLIALLTVIVTFFLIVFVGAGSIILLGYGPTSIIIELLIILLPLCYMLARHINIKTYAGIEIKRGTILKGIAFGGALLLLDIVVTNALIASFGPSQAVEDSSKLIVNLSSSFPGLLYITVGLFLAGVCEEFTFRAFLFNSINRRYSFLPALVISSLAFGFFHFDPQIVYILDTFSLGLVLGYVNYRYKSYVICAVAHSTLNLLVLVLSLLVLG